MKNNVILEKTYMFVLRIVKLYKYLHDKEFVLSKQILQNVTSVDANAEEGSVRQSKKEENVK